jgi:hypothetical protein
MLGTVHREVLTLGDELELTVKVKHAEGGELEKVDAFCQGGGLRSGISVPDTLSDRRKMN